MELMVISLVIVINTGRLDSYLHVNIAKINNCGLKFCFFELKPLLKSPASRNTNLTSDLSYSRQSSSKQSKMPSRNNPNKPSRSGGRVQSRALIAPTVRGARPKVDSRGLIRSGRVGKKKERKKLRNMEYTKARELEQEELQKLIETGEVEMKGQL